MFHTIEEAIVDLKTGKPIIVVDDESRENEGDFLALSEKVTPEIINFMITHGKGLVCVAIENERANKLDFPLMANQNTDPFGTAFTISVDHNDTTTGISADERSRTILSLTQTHSKSSDYKRPGHVFPLIAKDGGVLERRGHTEAAVDLAKLSHASPSGVICEIIKEDGTMARVPDLKQIAEKHDMKMITIDSLVTYRKKHERLATCEVSTNLPTEFGQFSIYGYSYPFEDNEHIAIVKGDLQTDQPILTRIHSECLTGDVFGSLRCDCGAQLQEALTQISAVDHGVLIYMRQEGRGIGLLNKLKAYELQDTGLDTVEANLALGFNADLRTYDVSAHILKDLGVDQINLLTNNPHKLTDLEECGIHVHKRIPIQTASRTESKQYMQTKYDKLGHLLTL